MKTPLVTLALFAFNQEAYIRDAVRSALAQSYSPLQIIFSDDASADATFAIIEAEAAAYNGPHRIVLNRNAKNLGIGGHINRMMELAEGELIVAAAGDDLSLPDRVSRLVEAWGGAGFQADSLHSSVFRITPEGEDYDLFSLKHRHVTSPREFIKRNVIVGASHAWTKRVFDKFGMLNPKIICEDRVIGFRSSLCGGIQYIDQPLVKYRLGGISNTNFTTLSSPIRKELKSSHIRTLDLMQNYNDYMSCTEIDPAILRLLNREIAKKIAQQVSIVARMNGQKFLWLRTLGAALRRG